MYKVLLKPFLFSLDPEKAHAFTLRMLHVVLSIPGINFLFRKNYELKNPKLCKKVMGLSFENPVGLAAGFDKDGKHYLAMAALGFGFIEIGTVTPRPQGGNPKPRLFRLPKDEAIINRMGFNNEGVDTLVERLKKNAKPKNLILGGNIGKNKDTPNEDAVKDYLYCFQKLFPWVDYFVVNVSSPNTPNLRELQEKEPLKKLLASLQAFNLLQAKPKPILLKIAPDLSIEQLEDVIEIVRETSIAGIVATNTSIGRESLQTASSVLDNFGAGGLSGKPIFSKSTNIIHFLKQKSNNSFCIIAVGGIDSPETAAQKLQAGADLIQVYSGLIYQGAGLVKKINKYLAK